MKKLFFTLIFIICTMAANAAGGAGWSFRLTGDGTADPAVEIIAAIEPGYHLFSVDNPEGGSSPLRFLFETEGCELIGDPEADRDYISEYDDIFDVEQHFYTGKVTFTQKLRPIAPEYSVELRVKGQTCDDRGCSAVDVVHSFKGAAPTR